MSAPAERVSRQQLEQAIADLRGRVADPRAGIHGPTSVSWRVHREAITLLGGGRAALLQLAHPFVAQAIDEHSRTRDDPVGRFRRTFVNVYAMVFGDLDDAVGTARRVHAIHRRIEGHLAEDVGVHRVGAVYGANEPRALLWVFATLVDTALGVHDLVFGTLTRADKERYYEEGRLFARLFGIPDALLPPDLGAFEGYFARMLVSDEIAVGEPAAAIAGFLLTPPNRAMRPVSEWYRLATTALLPPRLRDEYGLRYGLRERAAFAATMPAVRAAYRALPSRLRWVPAYVEARRRLSGEGGPDRFGRTLERLVLRGLTPARD